MKTDRKSSTRMRTKAGLSRDVSVVMEKAWGKAAHCQRGIRKLQPPKRPSPRRHHIDAEKNCEIDEPVVPKATLRVPTRSFQITRFLNLPLSLRGEPAAVIANSRCVC